MFLILVCVVASACTGNANSVGGVTPSSASSDASMGAPSKLDDSVVDGDQPGPVAGPVVVELQAIAAPNPSLLERWRDLTVHGYGIGPAQLTEQGWSDLADRHTGIVVAEFRLGWGIDSGAHLVVVEGTAEGIASAQVEVEPMADLVIGGSGWLAGLSRRVHAETWELRDLAEMIVAIREPETACLDGETGRVCPLGPEAGPSPPPPQLILADSPAELGLGVDIRFLGPEARGLRGTGGRNGVSWVSEGQVVLEFTLADPQLRGTRVIAANHLGGNVVSIEGSAPDDGTGRSRIAIYESNGRGHTLAWVPAGWVLDGLVLAARNAGASVSYEVIAVGSGETGQSIAVAVDADAAVRGRFDTPGPDLDTLSLIDLDVDHRWTLPQWTPAGVTVVAERSDGWFLVDDVQGDRTDLLRSSHPIIGYALDESARHAVLAIDGPTGIVNYWINDDEILKLTSKASSMAWFGTHRQ